MKELRKEYLKKYEELEYLNHERADFDFKFMVEELESPDNVFLQYFEIKDLEDLIKEISEAIEMEKLSQCPVDPVEFPFLCRNELI